jgi:hypothetical protein
MLKEQPDPLLVSEGQSAYFRLIKLSQHFVLTAARDYFRDGRDKRAIIIAGNKERKECLDWHKNICCTLLSLLDGLPPSQHFRPGKKQTKVLIRNSTTLTQRICR